MTVSTPLIRPLSFNDSEAVLALNQANEVETAYLDKEELEVFLETAFYAKAAGQLDGFCIAMDQHASYESPNFHWFAARYDRFIYVDRIIVAEHARGRGVAYALYTDLFHASRRAGHSIVCCEVNTDPPNPGSEKFHTRLSFSRIGHAKLHDKGKTVAYLTRNI